MRGTCSPGFMLRSRGSVAQIVPGSFADSSAQTMVPYSHILWAALWQGIAGAAVARAASQVRGEARKKPGTVPSRQPSSRRSTPSYSPSDTIGRPLRPNFDALGTGTDDPQALLGMGWALKLNNLKVSVSEAVVQIVHQALQITGILGYKKRFAGERGPALSGRALGRADDFKRAHREQERVDAVGIQGRSDGGLRSFRADPVEDQSMPISMSSSRAWWRIASSFPQEWTARLAAVRCSSACSKHSIPWSRASRR